MTQDPLSPARSDNVPQAMRADLERRLAQPKGKPGLLSRFFSRAEAKPDRGPRGCTLVAVMMMVDRGVALDGMVMAIGEREILFRQASTFILERSNTAVLLRFAEVELRGTVRETSAGGYWVRLAAPLSPARVEELLRFSATLADENA